MFFLGFFCVKYISEGEENYSIRFDASFKSSIVNPCMRENDVFNTNISIKWKKKSIVVCLLSYSVLQKLMFFPRNYKRSRIFFKD